MANSVGRIYNATLGDTQFQSDGEHTLFTNNSSTTRIIKEIKFSNVGDGLNFNNAYLSVDGHKVATLSLSGVSGELIVPPSSTVKMHLIDEYPKTFYKTRQMVMVNNIIYGNDYVFGSDETSSIVSRLGSSNKSITALSQPGEVIDVSWDEQQNYDSTNGWMYYITHDNNSVQRAYRTLGSNSYGHSSKTQYHNNQIQYSNYKGFVCVPKWHSPFANDRVGVGHVESGYWRVKDFHDAENGNLGFQQFSPGPGATSAGGISPSPTSSYPRAHLIGDFYWWIPSSGYTYNVYAMRLSDKQGFQFSFSNNWASSGNYDFTVSIDDVTDEVICWRPDGSNQVRKDVLGKTYTQMKTETSSGMINASNSSQTISGLSHSFCTQSMGAAQLSDRRDGGFGFKSSSGNYVVYDKEGNLQYAQSSIGPSGANYGLYGGATANFGNDNQIMKRTMVPMTDSERISAGLSQPTFQIEINGYTAN